MNINAILRFLHERDFELRSLSGGPGLAIVPRVRGTTRVFLDTNHFVSFMNERMANPASL